MVGVVLIGNWRGHVLRQASCSPMPSALRAELRHPAVGDNSISAAQTWGGVAPPPPLSAGAGTSSTPRHFDVRTILKVSELRA